MISALSTVDLLVKSVQHSYVAANELILLSSKNNFEPLLEADSALHQNAQFIINNTLGNPPVAIPLALFHSPVCYYLSTLHFDLPCYTISGLRFFKARRQAVMTVLHSATPTLWNKLFYRCYLYHIIIDVDVKKVKVSFQSSSLEKAARLKETKVYSSKTAWTFLVTAEQELQLLAQPKIIANPIYWRSAFMPLRHLLRMSL